MQTLNRLPRHIAIIMDGNGRWAKQRFLPRIAGHKAGIDATRQIVEVAASRHIEVLSLFIFSSENWRRPADEVDHIMTLFMYALQHDIKDLHKNNIKLKVIGDKTQFSQKLQLSIADAEKLTAENTGLTVVIAANYGGQWDILNATQQLLARVHSGELKPEALTPALFESVLSLADLPPPDLFIRTSGEQRISNFFLWQLAYAELYFSPLYWPDFDAKAFDEALQYYQTRDRRFGQTDEQLKSKISTT